jgi:hypothetical protein
MLAIITASLIATPGRFSHSVTGGAHAFTTGAARFENMLPNT